MHYFERLQIDLQDIGLLAATESDGSPSPAPATYNDFYTLLFATEDIGNPHIKINQSARPKTELGKRIFGLARDNTVQFGQSSRQDPLWACDTSELRLLSSLSQKNVRSSRTHSPIVLTRASLPVAIIKDPGTRGHAQSTYALVDDYDLGLVAGTFGDTNQRELKPANFGHHRGALVFEVPEVMQFYPIRFSFFMVPGTIRSALIRSRLHESDYMTSATHQEIQETAAHLAAE